LNTGAGGTGGQRGQGGHSMQCLIPCSPTPVATTEGTPTDSSTPLAGLSGDPQERSGSS